MLYLQKEDVGKKLPSMIILGISDLYLNIEGEQNNLLDLNSTVLREVIKCLKFDSNVLLSLETLCLNLASDGCYGELYKEFIKDYENVSALGFKLCDILHRRGLYSNGVFLYTIIKETTDSIYFLRNDVYYDEIRREVNSNS